MSSTVEEAVDATRTVTTLFDHHLRLLNDSYLQLFLGRRQVGEQYVVSLRKFHRRSRAVDTLDDRIEHSPLTAQTAWNEIINNVEREADTHQAFIDILHTQIIGPPNYLKTICLGGTRRKREHVRENFKDAIATHNDYAENYLPYLKRTYLRKSQEAEESRLAASASPTFPQEPNSSMSHGAQLNRSPTISTTSTALSDLRIQEKRSSNPLMAFLDRGGSARDGERSDSILRHLRAKREAEKADNEYRKGVYWQETLRLRRVKIVEAGLKSAEDFACELSDLMRKALTAYPGDLFAVGATRRYDSYVPREEVIDKIVPERDGAALDVDIPRLLSVTCPEPIFYYNFDVGECKDLIFGISLVDYATARNPLGGDIPKVIRVCIEDIDRRGLEAEGIYWVSGGQAGMQEVCFLVPARIRGSLLNRTRIRNLDPTISIDVYRRVIRDMCHVAVLHLPLPSSPSPGNAPSANGKAPLAKRAKFPLRRRNCRGKVIDHRIPVPKLEGSMDEPIDDRDELMKMLTASTRQTLVENAVMKKNDAAREAISADLQLMLPKVVKGYAASAKQAVVNATSHLRIDSDGSGTSDEEGFAYKTQETVDYDAYPKAIAPFLKLVHKIARMPTQNAAQKAMGLLLVVAQESTPEGQNQDGWNDAREKFDKAVDETFVVLAKKRKGLDNEAFDAKGTLVELKGIVEGLEELNISPTFEESIPLLESWVP